MSRKLKQAKMYILFYKHCRCYDSGEFYFRRSTTQADRDGAAVFWTYLGKRGSYNPTLVYVLTWYKVTMFAGQNAGYPVSQI